MKKSREIGSLSLPRSGPQLPSPSLSSPSDPAPEEVEELRCWLLVRSFDPMPWPKMLAQAGHGFVGCLEAARLRGGHWAARVESYLAGDQPRIVLKARKEEILFDAVKACTELADPLPCHLVLDEGRTVFPSPTYTALAIGPCYRKELPARVKKLQLF